MSAVFDPSDPPSEGTTEEDALREKITTGINENIPNIIGALTVALSSNYKETLTKPMDLTPRNPTVPFTTFERVRNASTLFAVYTIVGHWLEMAFCQLIRLGLVGGDYDRSNTMLWDWWLHPFPAEGIAGVLIAGGLSPLREVLLKRFDGRVAPVLKEKGVRDGLGDGLNVGGCATFEPVAGFKQSVGPDLVAGLALHSGEKCGRVDAVGRRRIRIGDKGFR